MKKIEVVKENEFSIQFTMANDEPLPETGIYYLLSEHEKNGYEQKLVLYKQLKEKYQKDIQNERTKKQRAYFRNFLSYFRKR